MSRRRKQGQARQSADAPTGLSDEPEVAPLDGRDGSDAEAPLDGDDAAQEPAEAADVAEAEASREGAQEAAGEPGAAGDASEVVPPVDGAPRPAEGPEAARSGATTGPWADLADGLADGDAEALVVPAPAVDQPPIARFVEDPPAPAPAAPTRPPMRRGHAFARVCGPGTLMATGYTLDGEQRSRWQAGEDGQFHRRDIASRPDCFEELP